MSDTRADVTDAFDNGTGVVFHLEMPGRRVMVHVPTATLSELGAGEGAGDRVEFVRHNEAAIQLLVDEGVASGWAGPVHLMI